MIMTKKMEMNRNEQTVYESAGLKEKSDIIWCQN